MKTTKKTLSLTKTTISNLTNGEMKYQVGGTSGRFVTTDCTPNCGAGYSVLRCR